jgi:hypothetical protein
MKKTKGTNSIHTHAYSSGNPPKLAGFIADSSNLRPRGWQTILSCTIHGYSPVKNGPVLKTVQCWAFFYINFHVNVLGKALGSVYVIICFCCCLLKKVFAWKPKSHTLLIRTVLFFPKSYPWKSDVFVNLFNLPIVCCNRKKRMSRVSALLRYR